MTDSPAERLVAAEVAAGERAADVVLRGGRVVDVHTGRILAANVATAGPRIAAVGDVDHCVGGSTEVIDCAGRFVVPGFVEPHFHIGGSQLTIERLAEVLVPRGTAALGTCFYEPAVIAGVEAAEELLARAEGSGLDILFSPFHAAALGLGQFGNLGRFGLGDLRRLVAHTACIELREWNYAVSRIPLPELQEAWADAVRSRRVVGGHLEGLSGRHLQASVALGPRSDHESSRPEEAIEKARAGVIVQIREGSGARDLDALVRAITEHGADTRCFSFSTDEQELVSLARDGHVDHKLRLAVAAGVAPIEAVRMATLNAATSLGVTDDYGSVAAGRIASLAVVENLASFRVVLSVSRGQLSGDSGRYLLNPSAVGYRDAWSKTVVVERRVEGDDFLLPIPEGSARVRVIGVTPGSLLTDELEEDVDLQGGRLVEVAGLAKIAVLDRHEGGERIAVGLIRGLGLKRGAFATTVNPGMMNVMVVGTAEEDMALATNRVVELGGGIVVARDGEVKAEVALPVFGILSHAPVAEVIAHCNDVDAALKNELGSPVDGLLTSAGFACLAVSIPSLKICDRGLVRVLRDTHEAVELVVGA